MADPNTFGKPVRWAYRAALAMLPENHFGDRIIAFLAYVTANRRLPRNRPVFNDVFYKIRISGELANPLRVFTSDKELVKHFVRDNAGDQYNVPTIAVLHTPEEVDGYDFPDRCCIKPTHASGHIILRKDGEPVDREKVKSWFKVNHYRKSRERNYKTLEPKIIVEPIIYGGGEVSDFKFHCVDGIAKLVQYDFDRHIEHKRLVFDRDWNVQDYGLCFPRPSHVPDRPANYAEMLELAEKLAAPFGSVRVDLYSDGKTCMLGELTHCHGGARETFVPRAAEFEASKLMFG